MERKKAVLVALIALLCGWVVSSELWGSLQELFPPLEHCAVLFNWLAVLCIGLSVGGMSVGLLSPKSTLRQGLYFAGIASFTCSLLLAPHGGQVLAEISLLLLMVYKLLQSNKEGSERPKTSPIRKKLGVAWLGSAFAVGTVANSPWPDGNATAQWYTPIILPLGGVVLFLAAWLLEFGLVNKRRFELVSCLGSILLVSGATFQYNSPTIVLNLSIGLALLFSPLFEKAVRHLGQKKGRA